MQPALFEHEGTQRFESSQRAGWFLQSLSTLQGTQVFVGLQAGLFGSAQSAFELQAEQLFETQRGALGVFWQSMSPTQSTHAL